MTRRKGRARVLTALLALACLAAAVLATGVGAVPITPSDVVAVLLGARTDDAVIVLSYRVPRVVCALLSGGMLAVAGVLLQAALRNDIASPDVVGVTKGAGLGAVIAILLVPPTALWALPLGTVVGATAAVAVLFLVVDRRAGSVGMALTGLAVGGLFQAATVLLLVRAPGDANRALLWLTGSLYGSTPGEAVALVGTAILLLPAVAAAARSLDLVLLSDESVVGLGRSPRRLRAGLVIVSVALSAAAVAVVGGIGFVGLLAPRIASALVGRRPAVLVPAAALAGALLLVVADLIGRIVALPSEVPAGVVTAVVGAPAVILLMRRSDRVR